MMSQLRANKVLDHRNPPPTNRSKPALVAAKRSSDNADGATGEDRGHVPVIIIGGGQAGLSVGYHLKRRGIPFLILDANDRIGDQWRRRWDSLRLFTPARFDGLDGMAFPAHRFAFPTKDQMGDYLESYAARFDLPVLTGARVDDVHPSGGGYVVTAGGRKWTADQVVVAMANFQRPKVPSFSAELDPYIVQLHSSEYRNPAQLAEGDVLIVGGGNSGAELAREAVRAGHHVLLAGRHPGHIPFRVDGFLGRHVLVPFVLRFLFLRVLTMSTPMGRRARKKILADGELLIRVKPKDLKRLGVERLPRLTGTQDGQPQFQNGDVAKVANVIWCTGFSPGFDWINLGPTSGADVIPDHTRGVVKAHPGLYFTGLRFLYAMSSIMIQGAGRDARYVAKRVAARAARVGEAGSRTTRSS
jgi:putative flavoprotein involved in K+ transport